VILTLSRGSNVHLSKSSYFFSIFIPKLLAYLFLINEAAFVLLLQLSGFDPEYSSTSLIHSSVFL
jgi:hypothetical protein